MRSIAAYLTSVCLALLLISTGVKAAEIPSEFSLGRYQLYESETPLPPEMALLYRLYDVEVQEEASNLEFCDVLRHYGIRPEHWKKGTCHKWLAAGQQQLNVTEETLDSVNADELLADHRYYGALTIPRVQVAEMFAEQANIKVARLEALLTQLRGQVSMAREDRNTLTARVAEFEDEVVQLTEIAAQIPTLRTENIVLRQDYEASTQARDEASKALDAQIATLQKENQSQAEQLWGQLVAIIACLLILQAQIMVVFIKFLKDFFSGREEIVTQPVAVTTNPQPALQSALQAVVANPTPAAVQPVVRSATATSLNGSYGSGRRRQPKAGAENAKAKLSPLGRNHARSIAAGS